MAWKSNPVGEARFSAFVQIDLRTYPASRTMGTGSLSLRVKWPRHGFDHPPQSSAEVKERVELNFYSSSDLLVLF